MDLTEYSPSDIKSLPHLPGIYFYYDESGVVIYIGKAKRLKARVSQYFQNKPLTRRLRNLVSQIVIIKIMLTETESDALILENRMIKKYKPKYNVLLKDDKTYPYICLSAHPYPRVMITRQRKSKQGQYFGPYTNGYHVRRMVELLQKLFRLRTCTDSYFSNRSRPCLLGQIDRCSAPCVGRIDKSDYAHTVNQAVALLSGDAQSVMTEFVKQMHRYSDAAEYEKAAEYRDLIRLTQSFLHDSLPAARSHSLDVVCAVLAANGLIIQVTLYRNSAVESRKDYHFPEANGFIDDLIAQFLHQFYQHQRDSADLPQTLLIRGHEQLDVPDVASVLEPLGMKVRCKLKPTTADERQYLATAQTNLECAVTRYAEQARYYSPAFEQLATSFQDSDWQFIDCVDISHLQGKHTTAACVRFSVSGAEKSSFRSYNLETGNDDYASMRTFIQKRFHAKTSSLVAPNCLLIDGGRGQISTIYRELQTIDCPDMHLLAICKAPGRRSGQERYYALTLQHGIQQLHFTDVVLRMLENIRDHAHRFAITKQRQKHRKASLSTTLDQIDGLGPKRIKNLLHYFGGMAAIKKATIKQLHQVPGISYDLAKRIYEFLHA